MPDLEKQIIEEAKQAFKFKDFAILSNLRMAKVQQFIDERKAELLNEYRQGRIKRARDIFGRTLRWKNPEMINLDILEQGSFDQMWVLPIFLAPGKHDFLLRSPTDKDVVSQLQCHRTDPRI